MDKGRGEELRGLHHDVEDDTPLGQGIRKKVDNGGLGVHIYINV